GMHEFLDGVQHRLIGISAEIGTAFFRDWRPLAAGQGQLQAQG
ncbi:MAG: alpha-E domain-containing protein, partial [Acetobacteraceae bacterium]|nr:alpha-E domain-containing protein [Acetobacteraceae bacterium]